jgi:hypothetical protein
MRHRRRAPQEDELDLFSPPIALPDWRSLPPVVRQQIRALLIEMFHPSQKAATGQDPPREVASE